MARHETDEEGHCLNRGCLHQMHRDCSRSCETEEQIADQIAWLRRLRWKSKYPWMARVDHDYKTPTPPKGW